MSCTLEGTHHRAYSSARLTTSRFKSSSPKTNFLASLSIPFRAGCVHFPPTLGVSGARSAVSVVPGVDILLCEAAGWTEVCSRWGVVKTAAGGTRCTGVGGVYGLWKLVRLLPLANVSTQDRKRKCAWTATRRSVKGSRRARRVHRLVCELCHH